MLFFFAPPNVSSKVDSPPVINTLSEDWVGVSPYLYLEIGALDEVEGEGVKLVTVKLPEKLVTDVDQLVKAGIYHNRSDAIRAAVRDLLRRELWRNEQR